MIKFVVESARRDVLVCRTTEAHNLVDGDEIAVSLWREEEEPHDLQSAQIDSKSDTEPPPSLGKAGMQSGESFDIPAGELGISTGEHQGNGLFVYTWTVQVPIRLLRFEYSGFSEAAKVVQFRVANTELWSEPTELIALTDLEKAMFFEPIEPGVIISVSVFNGSGGSLKPVTVSRDTVVG